MDGAVHFMSMVEMDIIQPAASYITSFVINHLINLLINVFINNTFFLKFICSKYNISLGLLRARFRMIS